VCQSRGEKLDGQVQQKSAWERPLLDRLPPVKTMNKTPQLLPQYMGSFSYPYNSEKVEE
jgi:hypothetical protein